MHLIGGLQQDVIEVDPVLDAEIKASCACLLITESLSRAPKQARMSGVYVGVSCESGMSPVLKVSCMRTRRV